LEILMQKYTGTDTSSDSARQSSWLAFGARLHKSPPPVRYPVFNTTPIRIDGGGESAPVRYPPFNTAPVAVSGVEPSQPARHPPFNLTPLDALRADALIIHQTRAHHIYGDFRELNSLYLHTPGIWLSRGLSFGLHASLVAFLALFSAPVEGDSNSAQNPPGMLVELGPLVEEVSQNDAPPDPLPTPVSEPLPPDQPEEQSSEEVEPEAPKPDDSQALTTANLNAENVVTAKIEEKKPEPPKKKPPKKEPPKKPRRAPAPKGGRSGAASAGDVSTYSSMVRARIAGHRPGGGGLHGSVTVSFAISGSGGLAYARVARSSGDSALDSIALQAVRSSAPFPPPPNGARINMAIPFYFK
jgi:periplasmic protein TonB